MRDVEGAGALDPRLLDESAEWLMRLHADQVTATERAAWEDWRQRSPEHLRAWARAEALLGKLQGLPAPLAMPVLDRQGGTSRRALVSNLGKLAALLAVAPTGWLVWREMERSGWGTDYRTAAGEQREVALPDGTRVLLNTATDIDVRFDPMQRLVLLRAGEVMVKTGHRDPADTRPFRIDTAHGRLEALGTRFLVRQQPGYTRLAVFEGAVRIDVPQAAIRSILRPGEQAEFSAAGILGMRSTDSGTAAWTQGLLLADSMPLVELVAELTRYRPGVVQCDESVAGLRVTGSFPVGNVTSTDQTLGMLASTYPLEVTQRLRGWWVTLQARQGG